ncbi:hypothetical protein BHE74_00029605 [Ensete ventricosum]|nr:hypothetical protein GW17_00048923 [Ensete ventricosum]RWW63231.1 hypothetical protein BHE74_00029605 [Ensete ventricosum]RZR91979.1 hypothetical protein BHM03_00020193 [Ensete ventricosum]
MERGSGGNDVELLCKTLQFEHKLFYFDLKENPRGRYLKISEKTSATRSTIIVPVGGIVWFVDLLNYYVNTDERDAFSKELKLDTKVKEKLRKIRGKKKILGGFGMCDKFFVVRLSLEFCAGVLL